MAPVSVLAMSLVYWILHETHLGQIAGMECWWLGCILPEVG